MRRVLNSRAFLVGFCLSLWPATPAAAQVQLPPELELLARIKQRAAANLSNIPNYVCLETIERFRRPAQSRRFLQIDTVRVEVADVGNKELFAWPGARPLGSIQLDSVIGFGAFGTGTFAGFAHGTFMDRGPTFHYVGNEKIDRRPAIRYDFHVTRFMSSYWLDDGKWQDVVPYSGSFWVDPNSLDLIRIAVRAEDIPPEIAMRSTWTTIDYARARIGNADFLLPSRAELIIIHEPGDENRNVTRFQDCRKYSAESAISFVVPAESGRAPAPPREIVLPAGMELPLRLQSTIDFHHNIVGDAIEATLLAPLVREGKELAPAGARVQGRIRRLERVPDIPNCYIVGMDFSEIELSGARAQFAAELEGLARLPGASQQPVCAVYRPTRAMRTPRLNEWLARPVHTTKIRGVSLLFISADRVHIARGLNMVWRTIVP